jgi:hypothetical protein
MLPASDRGPLGTHVLVLLLGGEATRGEGRINLEGAKTGSSE